MNPIKSPPSLTSQDEPVIPIAQRKTMTTLLPDDCCWPIGDPQVAASTSAASASRTVIRAANYTCAAPVRPAGRASSLTGRATPPDSYFRRLRSRGADNRATGIDGQIRIGCASRGGRASTAKAQNLPYG